MHAFCGYMSTRVCFIAFFFLILCSLVPAQAAENKSAHVFMWSVQGPASKAYLLGYIHVSQKGTYPLDERIEKAYQICPRTVFEADLTGANSREIKDMMLRLGTYEPGKTLKKEISPKTYAILKERLEAEKLKRDQFDNLKPWFAALSIAAIELKRLGFSVEYGMDSYFYRRAFSDKKNMIFLETAKQQLELLSKSFSGHEEDLLRQTLVEITVLEKFSSDLEQAWKTGDAEQMGAITRKSLKEFPEVEKKLFTERNKAWTVRISRLLSQKGDIFIVVGASHLVDDNGVLEMLKAKGYAVVQH